MTEAPSTLADAGRSLWDRLVGKYEFRVDELDTLEDICQIADVMASLREAWDESGAPMTTEGSMGQQVIHPLIGEIRTQRMAKNSLWRQLKIPDEASGIQENQHRSAAVSKWSARPQRAT